MPPGIFFIFKFVQKPLFATILVYSLRNFLLTGNQPSSLTWSFLYCIYPISVFVRGTIRGIRRKREMKELGAREFPSVHSNLPMGISIMYKSVQGFLHSQLGEIATAWQEQYGSTFSIEVLGDYSIVTFEPEHIKNMLSTNFDNFEKGPRFREMFRLVLGNGVFNADGDIWKFHRAMTRPFFVRDRVTDFDIFDRHADIAVNKMIERLSEGEPIDFQDVMSRLTLDSATEFLFGSCVHSLAAPLPYAHNSPRKTDDNNKVLHKNDRFAKALAEAQAETALRTKLGDLWPLRDIFGDRIQDSMAIINEYIDPILQEALENRKPNGGDTRAENLQGGPETLLSHLVQETDDIDIIRDEVINIMLAGRDTHPDVLATLRHEILTKIGLNRPTFDDLKECKYLRAVINETLRLYPPAPFNVRASIDSTTWKAKDGGKPYYVPAGCFVAYSVFVMHRRKDLWGPDGIYFNFTQIFGIHCHSQLAALEYDPNRFLDERVHKFAYNQTSFVLVRLLQAFDTITLDVDAQPSDSRPPPEWKGRSGVPRDEKIWMKSHLTLYAYKGLWLRMTFANQSIQ
ncbi:hypothetical protein Clacol_003107 [Clathrus columnatus]|uniref:Cytochrome P450 n=1 Tax=Clathrus columnatus TaxID=1419009 RepID=A0AAV5A5G0_9AGAM|nr:hypothetical protein Clacol_003107 [Clathrus columnatus]